MKKTFLKIVVIFIFTLITLEGSAQNSFNFQWGLFTPLNANMSKEFTNARNFSIGLLHPISNSAFSIGVTFSHQRYQPLIDYSTNKAESHFTIHNYLFSGRYDFLYTGDFKLYSAMDIGLNKTKYSEIKNGITREIYSSGFTTYISLGGNIPISKRFIIDANIQNQIFLITNIPLNNKEAVNHFNTIGGNIGFRFLLSKRKYYKP